MTPSRAPIRLAVLNDYEIVVRGVAGLLAPFAERVAVVELDSRVPVLSDVDVVLYDTFAQDQASAIPVADLLDHARARVLVFSWNLQPEVVQRAFSQGVAGYVSKGVRAPELVSAIESAYAGEVVVPPGGPEPTTPLGQWPGRALGLSARESEVMVLITQGLSNQEIAQRTYLSINSVKTYIRTAYRKIGVSRRAQAVAWGIGNGFAPDQQRVRQPRP